MDRKRNNGMQGAVFSCAFVLCILTADQRLKNAVRAMPGGSVLWQGQLLCIVRVTNHGGAFGLFSNAPILVTLSAVLLLAAAALLVIMRRRRGLLGRGSWAAFLLLAGGALGNLWDRFFYGGVTDCIRLLFIRFPVFNLADICITLGCALLVLLPMPRWAKERGGDGAH